MGLDTGSWPSFSTPKLSHTISHNPSSSLWPTHSARKAAGLPNVQLFRNCGRSGSICGRVIYRTRMTLCPAAGVLGQSMVRSGHHRSGSSDQVIDVDGGVRVAFDCGFRRNRTRDSENIRTAVSGLIRTVSGAERRSGKTLNLLSELRSSFEREKLIGAEGDAPGDEDQRGSGEGHPKMG